MFSKRAPRKPKTSFAVGGVQSSVGGSIEDKTSIWSEPKKVQFLQPGDCDSPGMREAEKRRLKIKKLEEIEKKNKRKEPKSHFYISRNKAIFAKQK